MKTGVSTDRIEPSKAVLCKIVNVMLTTRTNDYIG